MATRGVLAYLQREALAARREMRLGDEAVRIRGAWRTSYAIELAPTSSRLHLHYVVVQTSSQGCCYYEPAIEEPGVRDTLLGADAVVDDLGGGAWQIAALDAAYAQLCRQADRQVVLNGPNVEKATMRAATVCDEVDHLLTSRRGTSAPKITNIGVVGDIIAMLKRTWPDISLTASDYYQRIVGSEVNGVTVSHGSMTPRLVAEADIAVITGMTLATGTLDEILSVGRKHDTAIVIFAQTGAHFADAYLACGAATVLSEPLPFYLTTDGQSVINVYRAREGLPEASTRER